MSKFFEYIKKYDILIFVIFGFLLYCPSLFFDFLYDDVPYIVQNEYLNGTCSVNLFQFFIPKFVLETVYTPLTFIVYWLILKIFGINSFAFHFVGIFFYVFSSVVLFYLLKKIIDNYVVAFFATILYILHPCHVECTAWISAMGYNISALFFFLSFLYFIIAFDENKKLNYIYSVIFYIFAILSQPVAVTLPAILFLWVYCFRKEKLKESIKYICAYLPFLFLYVFLFKNTVSNSYRFSDFIDHSFLDKLLTFGHYIFNAFLPVNLSPFYVSSPFICLIFTIIGFILIFFIIYKKNNFLIFFLGFYLITIFPYLGIVFDNMILVCDRYLLLSSISFCFFISIFSFYLFEKLNNKILLKYISFVVFMILYFVLSFVYLPIWKNNESFWTYAYHNSYKKNISILTSYVTVLLNNGKYDEASILADDIIEQYPKFAEGYVTKIQSMMALNDIENSLKVCKKFRDNIPECLDVYIYFFDIYINLQEYDKALESLKYAYYIANKYNLYKNDKVYLFANKQLTWSYINAESNKFIENFKIISNNFKLLDDNGKFYEILNKDDYKSREDICLDYLKKYKSQYSNYIFMLLSCLYMEETYKDNASKIMRSSLKEINKAQESIKKGDNISAEHIYLNIIKKNKYMYEAYYNLGILYLQTNRQVEAKNIFNKILEINPNDEQIRQILLSLGN